MSTSPNYNTAGERESGVPCPGCGHPLRVGDLIEKCPRCGKAHHGACWNSNQGCASYDCAPGRRDLDGRESPDLVISLDDLATARPQPRRAAAPVAGAYAVPPTLDRTPQKVSSMAIAALIVAVLGLVVFGLVTGPIAIILGAIAAGTINKGRAKGAILAVLAVMLGLVDMIVWGIILAVLMSGGGPLQQMAMMDEFRIDPQMLENLSPEVRRAMEANVLISTTEGWFSGSIGAGVIIRTNASEAFIITNRHVIDPDYSEGTLNNDLPGSNVNIDVKLIEGVSRQATVLWVGDGGVDVALLRIPLYPDEDVQAVPWGRDTKLTVGEDVFGIGNPQNLGWTMTVGIISQLPSRPHGAKRLSLIQTDAAINGGNSGGGLYNASGDLLGINTWTGVKHVSEGLSFAITLDTILELRPPIPNIEDGGPPIQEIVIEEPSVEDEVDDSPRDEIEELLESIEIEAPLEPERDRDADEDTEEAPPESNNLITV
jgi:S1-C subfamily serine protease